MSLISDALKKAQLQRGVPSSNWTQFQPAYASEPRSTPASSRRLILLNVVVLAAIAIGALYFFDHRSTPMRTDEPPPVAAAPAPAKEPVASEALPSRAETATAPAPSPFLAASPVASAAPSESPDYNLAGISSLGNNTLLSVVRQSDKRSVWIPVGKTIGEITAVSYDSDNDRAVIRVHGRLLSIAMHDGGASNEPAPKAAE